jgi:hypothetical protein
MPSSFIPISNISFAGGSTVPDVTLTPVTNTARPTVNRWGDPVSDVCINENCTYCFTTPGSERIDMTVRNDHDFDSNAAEDISIDNGVMDDDCPACRLKNGLDTSLRPSTIHDYSSTIPGGWTPQSIDNDRFHWYMGIELETDFDYSQGYSNGDVLRRAANMRRPLRHWHAKHDGSVGGPEFASNPATITWWRRNQPAVAEMFRLLLHAGLRSYDGGKAGMHVNISKVAFDDWQHLFRFAHLIHIKPSWSTIMAQRTQEQVDHWSRFTNMGRTIKGWKDWASTHFNDRYSHTEKYSVLNIPSGGQRIEFRLPRGTLRIDRFMKNLEWTTAMIEYTRHLSSEQGADPVSFMKQVTQVSSEYPNLYGFINERASALITAAR